MTIETKFQLKTKQQRKKEKQKPTSPAPSPSFPPPKMTKALPSADKVITSPCQLMAKLSSHTDLIFLLLLF